eukprot:1153481-Pelagomonas_calceolata.AAC.8
MPLPFLSLLFDIPGQQQDITASRAQARTCRHHGSHGHVHGLATCRDEDGTVALTDQLGDDVGHHVGPAAAQPQRSMSSCMV